MNYSEYLQNELAWIDLWNDQKDLLLEVKKGQNFKNIKKTLLLSLRLAQNLESLKETDL